MELNYEKDNLERMPMEHYTQLYREMDPEAASARCQIPYDTEKKLFSSPTSIQLEE